MEDVAGCFVWVLCVDARVVDCVQADASSTPTAQKTVETSPARNAKDDEVVSAKKKKAELAAAKKAAEEEAKKKAQDEADKKVRL